MSLPILADMNVSDLEVLFSLAFYRQNLAYCTPANPQLALQSYLLFQLCSLGFQPESSLQAKLPFAFHSQPQIMVNVVHYTRIQEEIKTTEKKGKEKEKVGFSLQDNRGCLPIQ